MAFGRNIDQRKANKKNHIVDLFRQHTFLSKATARNYSRYSMDTIISVFNDLIKNKIIMPVEGEQKTKGRRAIFYTLNNDKWHYLGITFNQTGIYSAIISFSNIIKDKHYTALKLGISKNEFLTALISHIKSILSRNKLYEKSVLSFGFSIPGDIDLKTGILHSYTFMPFLKDVNFHEIIQSNFPKIKITIEHNIHSMTSYLLREKELISSYTKILFISARSGTGSGYINKGVIVTAHGEFGHIRVTDEDKPCICGRNGCLDCFFSYHGFIEILKQHSGKSDFITSLEEELSGISILSEYYRKEKNEIAMELDHRLDYFSMALLDVINVMVPDLVILTGDLFKVFNDPVEAVTKSIRRCYKDTGFVANYHNTSIQYKELSTEIASIGICFEMIKNDWDYSVE